MLAIGYIIYKLMTVHQMQGRGAGGMACSVVAKKRTTTFNNLAKRLWVFPLASCSRDLCIQHLVHVAIMKTDPNIAIFTTLLARSADDFG